MLAVQIGMLVLVFFPHIFLGKSLLPTDLADTMTMPVSQEYSHQTAFNSLVGDGYFQTYPLEYYARESYLRGSFAYWNPWILGGYPQYLEGMWIYNIPLLLFSGQTAMLLVLLLPLLVGGIGFYYFLRDYAVRPGISLIFSTAYMLNSMHMSYLFAHFMPGAFSFVPFAILYLKKYSDSHDTQKLISAAVFIALAFLGGISQTAAYVLFTVIIFWICNAWSKRDFSISTNLVVPLVLIVIAFGLTMMYWLPTIELFGETHHVGDFYSTSLYRDYSIGHRALSLLLTLTFLIPQLNGSIRGIQLTNGAGVFTIDFQGAFGFVTLLFSIWGAVTLWRKKPAVRPFVVLMILGIGLPILTPLFRFLYHRFLIVYVFGACVTGALGMEALLSNAAAMRSIARWAKTSLFVLVGLSVLLIALALVLRFNHEHALAYLTSHFSDRLSYTAFAEGNAQWSAGRIENTLRYWELQSWTLPLGLGLALLGSAVVYIFAIDRLRERSFMYCVAAITFCELLLFAYSWLPRTDINKYPPYHSTHEWRTLQKDSAEYRTLVYRYNLHDRPYQFVDNQNVIFHIAEWSGYESVIPRCFFLKMPVWSSPDHPRPNFLGLLNIRHLVTNGVDLHDPNLVLVDSSAVRIYENRLAKPRYYFAHTSQLFADDTAVVNSLLSDSATTELARFITSEPAPVIASSASATDSIQFRTSDAEHLSFQVKTAKPAYLIVTDTYYPGWIAMLDGRPSPIYRVNYAMRAVLVPAGEHVVEMSFEPNSFRTGLYLSIATLVLCCGAFVFVSKRSRPTSRCIFITID